MTMLVRQCGRLERRGEARRGDWPEGCFWWRLLGTLREIE